MLVLGEYKKRELYHGGYAYLGPRPSHVVVLPLFYIETPDKVDLKRQPLLYDHNGEEIPYKKAKTVGFKPFRNVIVKEGRAKVSKSGLEKKAFEGIKALEGWDFATKVLINGQFVPIYSLINPNASTLPPR